MCTLSSVLPCVLYTAGVYSASSVPMCLFYYQNRMGSPFTLCARKVIHVLIVILDQSHLGIVVKGVPQ